MKPLTFSIFGSLYTVFLKIISVNCHQTNSLGTNCMKTVVCIGLKQSKVTASLIGWRKKERDWLHARLRRKRETFDSWTNSF